MTSSNPVSLQLREAVYGPLANGADVQLLAWSAGLQLSDQARNEFQRFYYAGWRTAAEGAAPSISLIPLDLGHWGLIRSHVLGQRSMGLVFVSWMIVLSEQELDQIGWQTHLLWPELLPENLRAPLPGTILEPETVDLHVPEGPATDQAAEALAWSVATNLENGSLVGLWPNPKLGGTHEDALSAVIDQLGPELRGRSYSSAQAMALDGFEARNGPIEILAVPAEVDLPGRTQPVIHGEIDPVWRHQRAIRRGLDVAGQQHLAKNERQLLARHEFDTHRSELMRGSSFDSFQRLATEGGFGRQFLLEFFEVVFEERGNDQHVAPRIVDAFVKFGLPNVLPSSGNPSAEIAVASTAIQTHAIFRVHPETIRKLGRALFGDPDQAQGNEFGLFRDLDSQLFAFSSGLDGLDAETLSALKEIQALAPDKLDFEPFRARIEAIIAALSDDEDGLAMKLEAQDNFRKAVAARDEMLGLLPDRLKHFLAENARSAIARKALVDLSGTHPERDMAPALLHALQVKIRMQADQPRQGMRK